VTPKIKALLAFLKAMGCSVKEFPDHAMINFDRDSEWTDMLRKTIWEFKRVHHGVEWYSETPYSGEITW
jgi:hypothetical protein